MFCSKCGNQIVDEAVICPNCGCPTSNYMKPKQEMNVGYSDDYIIINEYAAKAKRAKTLGIVAVLLSWGIGIIFSIIGIIISPKYPPEVTTTLPHEIAELNKAKRDMDTAAILYFLQFILLGIGILVCSFMFI